MGYTLYSIFYFFTIYSFMGWAFESTLVSITSKKFVNRGFLNGPFCPIYAVGALSILLALSPLKNNITYIYIGGCIVATIVEYIIGFTMEKLFHAKWWDYSDKRFNLDGRICLTSSIGWGFLSILMMYLIQPFVERVVNKIPINIGYILIIFLIAYFLTDTIITVYNVIKLNGKLEQIRISIQETKERLYQIKGMDISEELKAKLNESLEILENRHINIRQPEFIDSLKNYIEQKSKNADLIKEKYLKLNDILESSRKIFSKKNFVQERLLKAYPHIKSTNLNEYLTELKELIKNRDKN